MPDTIRVIASRTSPITARPAANLPMITASRWIGWETRRGRVRSERSPLIASNPKAIPRSGPSRPTSAANEGTCEPEAWWLNSWTNRPVAPLASWAFWPTNEAVE